MGKKINFLKPFWWDNFLKDIFSPTCSLCSFLSFNNGLCLECEKAFSAFLKIKEENDILTLFIYEKEIRDILLKWKASRHYYLSEPLAYFIGTYIPEGVDFIILAPSSFKRRKREGVDPLEIIGRFLAKKGHLVLSPFYRRGLSQKVLSRKQRKENISHSLFLKRDFNLSFLKDRKVLILDDLVTTGSTLEALEVFLTRFHPKSISKMAFCRSFH